MTLAVAVRFPFGRLAVLNRELVLGMDEAVILATDSRISAAGRGDVLTDRGRKLFRIANDAALVYSGDTLAAQASVRDVVRYFQRRRPGASRDATPEVSRIIREAYQRERRERDAGRRRTNVGPLSIIVGVCNPANGKASVIFMGSGTSFEPFGVSGWNLAAGGVKGEAANFEEKLHALDDDQWARPEPPPFTALHWQLIVVAALTLVLEREDKSSVVGGPIQTALLTRDGFFSNEFAYLGEGCDPLNAASWKIATIPLADTEQTRRAVGRAECALV